MYRTYYPIALPIQVVFFINQRGGTAQSTNSLPMVVENSSESRQASTAESLNDSSMQSVDSGSEVVTDVVDANIIVT